MFSTPVGDITEVFDKVRQVQHTGVIVRAAHNRGLDSESERMTVEVRSTTKQF